MAADRILPDKSTLRHWIEDEGLSHQECADRVYELTGRRVGRSAISVAVHRYGLSKPGHRYPDYTPWHTRGEHVRAYPLRMLRLMGRRDTRGAEKLSPADASALEGWLRRIEAENVIVGYDPNDEQGVHYIPAKFRDHDGPAPVRRTPLRLKKTA